MSRSTSNREKMSVHNPIVWITAANVLYLISYSVRDILWLRILTVVAALLLIPYYEMQPKPLTDAIRWNVVFTAINVYWIVRLGIERRPVHFTPDEARLKAISFPSLTAQEAKKLFAMGRWDNVAPGLSLVQRDKETQRFSVILRGSADVVHGGTKISELGQGQFVGTIDVRADELAVDVLVRREVRAMCWARDILQSFLSKRPDVDLALERSVGLEVQNLLGGALSKLGGTPA
ncbi:MAG: hypothetical protein WAK16_10975 [Candidatus Cybelea sp.]